MKKFALAAGLLPAILFSAGPAATLPVEGSLRDAAAAQSLVQKVQRCNPGYYFCPGKVMGCCPNGWGCASTHCINPAAKQAQERAARERREQERRAKQAQDNAARELREAARREEAFRAKQAQEKAARELREETLRHNREMQSKLDRLGAQLKASEQRVREFAAREEAHRLEGARKAGPVQPTSCSGLALGDKTPTPTPSHCRAAKKSLDDARAARPASPAQAAKLYKDAAKDYRLAGDIDQAALVMLEAAAPGVTPFIEKEGISPGQKKNIEEAENLRRLGKKIEEGAFEDNSCADLLVAADYYLRAGSYYLKSDQFAMTNTILLRRDRLVSLVDEAKQNGQCGSRLGPRPPPVPDEPKDLADDPQDCAGMRARLEKHAPNEGWIIWHMTRAGCLPNGTPMPKSKL